MRSRGRGIDRLLSGRRGLPRQFAAERHQLLGQVAQLVELLPEDVRLLVVHRAERLEEHHHRLLELVEHLLLHEAESVDHREQERVEEFDLLCGLLGVGWNPLGGEGPGRRHDGFGGAIREAGRGADPGPWSPTQPAPGARPSVG